MEKHDTPKVNDKKSNILLHLLLIGLLYLLISAVTARPVEAASFSKNSLYSYIDSTRSTSGISNLKQNSELEAAALAKAKDMATKNYWSHSSPDGLEPWYFMKNAGYSYTAAGENLAMDYSSAKGVYTGWMNSPSHRANIMQTKFEDIGIAVYDTTLLGKKTTLVVAMFGAEKVQKTTSVSSSKKVQPTATTPSSSQKVSKLVENKPQVPASETDVAPSATLPADESVSDNMESNNKHERSLISKLFVAIVSLFTKLATNTT